MQVCMYAVGPLRKKVKTLTSLRSFPSPSEAGGLKKKKGLVNRWLVRDVSESQCAAPWWTACPEP